MFIDLNAYAGPADIETDVCIVGAGAAGITLALELNDTGKDVCVLESGGLDYDAATQSLADGDNIGIPYYPLIASRLRFFGGTTNHWGGISTPMDELDFQEREGIPYSGWPITRASLDPWYERANEYCKLGPYNYDPNSWAEPDAPVLLDDGGRVGTTMYLEKPVRFGQVYREQMNASRNIQVFLSANVTELEARENGASVARAHVQTLNGKRLIVSARTFVVATGAVENARLLLASRKVQTDGLGNDRGLVGRFFMEHPLFPAMELQLSSKEANLALYTGRSGEELLYKGYWALAPETTKRERILSAKASLTIGGLEQRAAKALKGVSAAIFIWNAMKEGHLPPDFGRHVQNLLSDLHRVTIYSYERAFLRSPSTASITVQLEQAPNPDSRITLSDELDRLGMQKVQLDWRMGDLERRSVVRFGELLGMEIGRAGIGRARLVEQSANGWWTGTRGAWHQMGTTRMHSDPTQGVVDANCRVHGIDNLYMAGGSVFSTAGSANPTLTMVALAARLAEHFKGLP
jgi:choline dehydrogenase-like flavoprotein